MKTCSKCHKRKRSSSFPKGRSDCKACRAAYMREYRTRPKAKEYVHEYVRRPENLERQRVYAKKHRKTEGAIKTRRAHYHKNKLRIAEQRSLRRLNDGGRISTRERNNRRSNIERYRMYCKAYAARRKELPATLTNEEWQWLIDQTEQSCIYCGDKPEQLEQEHVIPVTMGGGYTLENIRPSCLVCNRKKGGRTPEQAGMTLIEEYEVRIQDGDTIPPVV